MKEKCNILIVEDEIITAMGLRSKLTTLGYGIVGEAVTGDEAIRMAGESQPDLVLMDIRLKGEADGVDTAKRINEQFDIPIIYLTAYSDEHTLKRAKITAPYSYLHKPFALKDLHTAIELALYRHDMEKKLKESERWLSTTLNSIGDGVIATDPKGCIKFMNPLAEGLTGWKEEDAVGKDLRKIFQYMNESDDEPMENPGIKALKTGKKITLPKHSILITKNGERLAVDDSAAPIKDDNGDILGVVLVFRALIEEGVAEKKSDQLSYQMKETLTDQPQ